MTASWRRAYRGRIATARAGNVIGGGDYGEDRIVPDCIRALLAGTSIAVRNPAATRPWQHVLDCLSGYLWLGARLAEEETLADAFNFGPRPEAQRPVRELVDTLLQHWPGEWTDASDPNAPHEAHVVVEYRQGCDRAELDAGLGFCRGRATNRPLVSATASRQSAAAADLCRAQLKPTPRRPPLNPAFGLADMEVTGFQCRSCQSLDGLLVLDLGEQPLANNFLSPEDLDQPEPRFPLRLAVCPNAGCCRSPISCRRWTFQRVRLFLVLLRCVGGTRRRVRGRYQKEFAPTRGGDRGNDGYLLGTLPRPVCRIWGLSRRTMLRQLRGNAASTRVWIFSPNHSRASWPLNNRLI